MEPLSPAAVRTLGALMEKSMTTPEYYPMTLNALVAACNQKSNREPVTHYTPGEVEAAHDELRARRLGHKIFGSDSRVAKYNQTARETLGLDQPQAALLCTLLLRGAQTVGELRQRSARMHEFADLGAADAALETLVNREGEALVVRLPRSPGSREARSMHLLGGEFKTSEAATSSENAALAPPVSTAPAPVGRIAELEEKVDSLNARIEALTDLIRQLSGS